MDHEKQARSDATELKLKVLDDKLLRAQITEEEKLRPLNEQIERLMEELSAERLSREVRFRFFLICRSCLVCTLDIACSDAS